jgi:hypothetical protein
MGPTNQMMGYCNVTLPEQGRIQDHATSVLIDNIFFFEPESQIILPNFRQVVLAMAFVPGPETCKLNYNLPQQSNLHFVYDDQYNFSPVPLPCDQGR